VHRGGHVHSCPLLVSCLSGQLDHALQVIDFRTAQETMDADEVDDVALTGTLDGGCCGPTRPEVHIHPELDELPSLDEMFLRNQVVQSIGEARRGDGAVGVVSILAHELGPAVIAQNISGWR
jgi:hypothetical protein